MYRPLITSNSLIYILTFHIKHGNIDKIREILQLGRLDEKQGHTLLFCAVLCKQFEIVSELLAQGCQVTIAGDSAPFRMALLSGNLKIVELLVVHGADLLIFVTKNPDIFRANGNYLCRLIHFVIQGRTTDVKETLHHLKLSQILRYEVMRLAVACGYTEMVKELLSLDFEINIKSIDCKQSPLEIAISRDNFEMAELLETEKAYLF
ncbi:hypothetical protein AVEN_239092-1 [Araneus ventricosus]|uniref:Alpha-latrotoxin n=1 Tax=Araneus ventricosus TaxID=182803 RepID=A0A4Y2W9Z4_ARAVE|nr:hypothetical protein AVEN_239092-1 [Araneus ventricosus]